jgi:hypothetical protein
MPHDDIDCYALHGVENISIFNIVLFVCLFIATRAQAIFFSAIWRLSLLPVTGMQI